MDAAWSRDFSYGYARKLLEAIRDNFDCRTVARAFAPPAERAALILRHDCDVSLKRALPLARLEHELGIHATYMVIPTSALYRLDQPEARAFISEIVDLGHEFAMHFDLDDSARSGLPALASAEDQIAHARDELEHVAGMPIRSISFHRPLPQFLRGPRLVCGMVNAYAAELMESYISDSKGCWRSGEPLPKLQSPQTAPMQVLIHPVWWGEAHLAPEDRLQEFFEAETAPMSPRAAQCFDAGLAATLPGIRRRRYPAPAAHELHVRPATDRSGETHIG